MKPCLPANTLLTCTPWRRYCQKAKTQGECGWWHGQQPKRKQRSLRLSVCAASPALYFFPRVSHVLSLPRGTASIHDGCAVISTKQQQHTAAGTPGFLRQAHGKRVVHTYIWHADSQSLAPSRCSSRHGTAYLCIGQCDQNALDAQPIDSLDMSGRSCRGHGQTCRVR